MVTDGAGKKVNPYPHIEHLHAGEGIMDIKGKWIIILAGTAFIAWFFTIDTARADDSRAMNVGYVVAQVQGKGEGAAFSAGEYHVLSQGGVMQVGAEDNQSGTGFGDQDSMAARHAARGKALNSFQQSIQTEGLDIPDVHR